MRVVLSKRMYLYEATFVFASGGRVGQRLSSRPRRVICALKLNSTEATTSLRRGLRYSRCDRPQDQHQPLKQSLVYARAGTSGPAARRAEYAGSGPSTETC